jgi:hypothetical protein
MTVKNVNGITGVLYALIKSAAWGAAVACGAGSGILLKGDSLTKKQPNVPDNATGSQFEGYSDLGNIDAGWGAPADLAYDGYMLMLALAMGTAGVPAAQGTGYKHTLKIAASRAGLFATFIKNYRANIFEAPSVKLTGFKISGPDSNGLVNIEFKGIAFDKLQGSATNTIATFANVTFPYKGNRVLFKQGVFRLNTQSAAALASPADVIKVSKFELNYDWSAKGELTSEFGNRIDEPTDDGKPVVTLKLDFPRYDDAGKTRIDTFDAEALLKADITFTGALISGTDYRTMAIRLPQLKMERPDQPFNAATIPQSVTYRGQAAAAAPLGMRTADMGYDLVNPFDLMFINTQSTNPLA